MTPTANSADARVGYRETLLYVRIAAFDRRLWYDTSPSPQDMLAWDSVSLYLDLDGNQGSSIDAHSYRFDGQLVWYEPRENYQAVYDGSTGGWSLATLPFTTTSEWAGDVPNDDVDDRGWALKFSVPYSSLGLDGPPPEGTVWGMALVVHDRDDAGGTPIADQFWPETMNPLQPATWGQVAFGLPVYTPPPAAPGGTLTIRQGLDGAVVPDGMVGGSSVCGEGLDYWTEWGEANYAGEIFGNIQNLGPISEWPCFSRYYVTFPLDALPTGSTVISATLRLYQFGNAGQGEPPPGPQPSLIQVLTISEDWDEASLTWNNSPLAVQNVSAAWAFPLDPVPPWPGVPRFWDVSGAVAEAHASGEPLRLALYESDWAYHSGKYFVSSDASAWETIGLPTLIVTWGQPTAQLVKSADPRAGDVGTTIEYALRFTGTGQSLVLTDTLPVGLGDASNLEVEGSGVLPTYDDVRHMVTWSDTVPETQPVIIRYECQIVTAEPRALVNVAKLVQADGVTSIARATVLANPLRMYLPLVARRVMHN